MKKLVLAIVVVSAAACTGEDGADGMNGTNGVNGAGGLDGMNGATGSNGANGNDVIISDSAKHGLDISPVAINTTGMTSAQIEAIGQGSYLVNALADCGSCHGEAGTTPGFLAGGKGFSATTANPNGTIFARNLTPDATTGMKLSEAEFLNAMRVGWEYTCNAGGCTASTAHTLKIMPWADYRWSSTSDLKAIYAYLKAIPAVANAVTADIGPWGAAPATFPTTYTDGAVARTLPAETDTNGNPIPDPGFARRGMAIQPLDQVISLDATTEQAIGRGSYLINSYGRCKGCHSATTSISTWMTGGKIFTTPGISRAMSSNLVGMANSFLAEGADYLTFAGIIQTGTKVDDNPAPPLAAPMPWQHFRDLTAEDLAGMYTYLSSVWSGIAATPTPTVTQVTADPITQDASFYCTANTDCTGVNETCDLTATSTTYHECIGRACDVDTDCRVCQKCSGTGGMCGAFTATTTCVTL